MAQAILNARRAVGLTQEQLGRRIGLQASAVYRWERDDSIPNKRNQRALVTAINAVNQDVAAKLAAALAGQGQGAKPAPAPEQAAPPLSAPVVLELAVFGMADELDLPARRIRGSLARLLKRLRESNLTLEVAQRQLELWIASAQ
jgi:transcriptional regulator with XRE-family HTH domain